MSSKADKLYKKTLRDQQKRLKPGECQKYVRLAIDAGFANSPLGLNILAELQNANINTVTKNMAEGCVYWERSVGQRKFISNEELVISNNLNDDWQMEKQVLKLLTKSELKYHVRQKTLGGLSKQFCKDFPNMIHTLVVPSLKDKSEYMNDIARAIVDVQIEENVSVIQIHDKPNEFGALICRFTKAVAEAPYKQQKSESLGAFKKYVANDKKQCVRVVGSTGFGRLWQQHLNRLPMVTLDVAEAIISQYKCPKQLLESYESNSNVIAEIADIRLNRGGAPEPLRTERRIGNILSTKLYTLYNTRDPNALI